jgi:hypothetical protein
MQTSRSLLAAFAWVFVALLLVQVFLAGIAVFGAGGFAPHRWLGLLVALVLPIILLVTAAAARAGRLVRLSALLLGLGVLQAALPWLRGDAPYVAALHPVNALVIAWLGVVIARGATVLARDGRSGSLAEPRTIDPIAS